MPTLKKPVALALLGVVYFAAIGALVIPAHVLYDSDAYYHLAVARLYATDGLAAKIPWSRMSILGDGGDKDFLFHVALIPFAHFGTMGARIALAAFDAAIALLIASIAMESIGWAGALVPLWLWAAAPPFFGRVVRLRPELFALALIVAALLPFRRRPRALAVLAFLFALSYTAIHVFVALCVLWALAEVLAKGRMNGMSAGGAESNSDAESNNDASNNARPFSPPRGEKVAEGRMRGASEEDGESDARPFSPPRGEKVAEGRMRGALTKEAVYPALAAVAGMFIRPHPIANLRIWFVQNVEFFLHKAALNVGNEITAPDAWYFTSGIFFLAGIVAMISIGPRRRQRDAHTVRALIAAALFTLLFLFFSRMAVYAFPLIAIAALSMVEGRSRAPLHAIALVACAAFALPEASSDVAYRALRIDVEPEAEWRSFGAAIPAGARVAADWAPSEHYAWFAPQGRYLNVLDPVFMAVEHPRESAALRRLYAGGDPDVPVTVATTLDSDYLALSRPDVSSVLIDRVTHDPRFTIVRDGINVLARVERSRFVQLRFHRVVSSRCDDVAAAVPASASALSFEFAPYGPSLLAVDGKPLAATRGTPGAILGRGYRFQLPPSSTSRRLAIHTCRADDGGGGFYLVPR